MHQIEVSLRKVINQQISFVTPLIEAIKKEATIVVDNPPKIFLIGGAVRDLILGNSIRDFDFEIYGVAPIRVTEIVENCFPGEWRLVGRFFQTIKLTDKVTKGIGVDITLPRFGSAKTRQSFFSALASTTPLAAANQRDFSINTVAIDLSTLEVFDPISGIKDLNARILKIVSPKSFKINPIRTLRACQLLSRYHLTAKEETTAVIKKVVMSKALLAVHPNRVAREIYKLLLLSNKPELGIQYMYNSGILNFYLGRYTVNGDTAFKVVLDLGEINSYIAGISSKGGVSKTNRFKLLLSTIVVSILYHSNIDLLSRFSAIEIVKKLGFSTRIAKKTGNLAGELRDYYAKNNLVSTVSKKRNILPRKKLIESFEAQNNELKDEDCLELVELIKRFTKL